MEQEIFDDSEFDKNIELIDNIDNLCQKLYDSDIETVYKDYAEFSSEELKKILKSLEEKQSSVKKATQKTQGKYYLKKLWDDYFKSKIIDQPIFCGLYFYALMGRVFFDDFIIISNNIEEDIRIHPTIISPPGTGKSESNDLLAKTIKQIPKKTLFTEEGEEKTEYFTSKVVNKITDAALIGSFDSALFKEQKNKKIMEGDPRYITPITSGFFKDYDLVIFDEAEAIFKPNRFSEEIQIWLRKVMNRYGSEGNYISNDSLSSKGKIGYYSSSSIVMTSYYLENFNKTLQEGGLLQRTSLVIDEEDIEKRMKIQEMKLMNLGSKDDPEFLKNYEASKAKEKKFIKELTRIKQLFMKSNEYSSEKEMIGFPLNVKEKIRDSMLELNNIIYMSPSEKESFLSSLGRMFQRFTKYVAINAIMEKRVITNVDDVNLAFLMVRKEAISAAEFIKEHGSKTRKDMFTKYEKDLIKVLKRDNYSKMQLNKKMATVWGIGETTASSRLKKFIDSGLIEMVSCGEGNKKICKIKKGIKRW